VVELMRCAAISASSRSRLRLSSRLAMSCCQARYAPPVAGHGQLARQQEVARVALGHFLQLAALAERLDVLK
jgi:hypothetical protein